MLRIFFTLDYCFINCSKLKTTKKTSSSHLLSEFLHFFKISEETCHHCFIPCCFSSTAGQFFLYTNHLTQCLSSSWVSICHRKHWMTVQLFRITGTRLKKAELLLQLQHRTSFWETSPCKTSEWSVKQIPDLEVLKLQSTSSFPCCVWTSPSTFGDLKTPKKRQGFEFLITFTNDRQKNFFWLNFLGLIF